MTRRLADLERALFVNQLLKSYKWLKVYFSNFYLKAVCYIFGKLSFLTSFRSEESTDIV